MTPKEEKLLQTQLRQHIGRTVNPKDRRFPGIRAEAGKTIFTDGAILCVYDYVLPEIPKDGFYKMPTKGAFVFESEAAPDIGALHYWRSVFPLESMYTEEVDFARTACPDYNISRLLAHLGGKGILLNLRYFLDLPQGSYTIKYLPAAEGGKRVPIRLHRKIADAVEFMAVLMPMAHADIGVRRITPEQGPGAEIKPEEERRPDEEQNTEAEEHE